jgi:KDO2-lipid IV(A) lauroyltransferase
MKCFLHFMSFYALLPWFYCVALLPYYWLYKLSDLCFFLVYYVIQYRKKIVWKNLQYAFPDKSPDELTQLSRSFYQYLCDLILEHIKMLTLQPAQLDRYCKYQNPEVLQQLYQQGKHVILVAGHYGNWEWAGNTIALQTPYQLYAIYQPLENPYFNTFLKKLRTRFNRKVMSQGETFRCMSQYGKRLTATALLADQAPLPTQAYIMPFLDNLTYVGQGFEKLAKKLNHAVVYISTQRMRRGYYSLHASLLSANPATEPPTLLTKLYLQHLEADIKKQPATWLWSHRRWKNPINPC